LSLLGRGHEAVNQHGQDDRLRYAAISVFRLAGASLGISYLDEVAVTRGGAIFDLSVHRHRK